MNSSAISLLELNSIIRETIHISFSNTFWLIAEISEINIARNGHCYLELIQKGETKDEILARSRANIWVSTFKFIGPYFEESTGQQLSRGMKILFEVGVEFHEVYGISLTVFDIDPNYTIGDLMRQRSETIKRLDSEGVMNMNKELELTEVPQRIAIISSSSAAGYGDFIKHIIGNPELIRFKTRIFNTLMQGNQAESSIINAFDSIYEKIADFDCVILIRGGGAKADLNVFDSYSIAYYISQFPLPIITGIGHERDYSVCDLVAHTSLKTPTAVAEFLINRARNLLTEITDNEENLINSVITRIKNENQNIVRLPLQLTKLASQILDFEKNITNLMIRRIQSSSKQKFLNEAEKADKTQVQFRSYSFKFLKKTKNNLDVHENLIKLIPQKLLLHTKKELKHLEKTLKLVDPEVIIKRGYSLTFSNGKILKSVKNIRENSELTTKIRDGEILSTVLAIISKNQF
jgi:exodeoxyribonuclease VII large subunit